MKILVITPAGPDSKAGNRATAVRWQALLGQSGHQVMIETRYTGQHCDLMIALHAWRSAEAIQRYRQDWPRHPLIVVLTGTDLYHHLYQYPEVTLSSMEQASVLIGLHDLVANDIPERFRGKLLTLRQSAAKPELRGGSRAKYGQFGVCVIGHLREEKDSLRAALAARHLPEDSRIEVFCAGKPHNSEWEKKALREACENPRFHWLGELDKKQLEPLMAESRLMVISSIMEGGANVVSEACRAGLPILASDIAGNRGLLGPEYPGYFPPADDFRLADLMLMAERNSGYLEKLTEAVSLLACTFTPEKERRSLEQALALAIRSE